MKLIMAISQDNCVARSPQDDMSWLGASDKAAFRLLTGVGGVLGVSARTANFMPPKLTGRKLVVLSHHTMDLTTFHTRHPDAWLLGGQTLALSALELGFVTEAHLCRSTRYAFPHTADDPSYDMLTSSLKVYGFTMVLKTPVGDTVVENWRKHPH